MRHCFRIVMPASAMSLCAEIQVHSTEDMMASHRIESFLHKSWDERFVTARYLVRKSLAKLPYALVPVRMKMSQGDEIQFWWSYVVPYFDQTRGIFDYWGHDLGDLRFLWKNLQPGMVFLDIGAHHGIYSIVAAKKIGAHGTVVAFEPSSREYRRLRLHLRMNRLSSVRREPLALGSTASTRTFFQVTSGDTTRGGLQPPASADQVSQISVETARLDDYVSQFPLKRVDLVKLDVEGSEREVLQGASIVLTKFRPIFICEVLDATTHAWGYRAREIIAKLESFDFQWFEIRLDGSIVLHKIRDCYPEIRNYVAVPKEKCAIG
jgi:FkbM family methyltransferase